MGTAQDAMDKAVAAITAEDNAADSIITLVNQLTGIIKANVNDPTALNAAADAANAKVAAIVAAVTANTPVTPALANATPAQAATAGITPDPVTPAAATAAGITPPTTPPAAPDTQVTVVPAPATAVAP